VLRPLKRSSNQELMDDPAANPLELRANFEDLRRINERWGGHHSTRAALAPALSHWPPGHLLSILDVGCGGGDLLVALAQDCRARRIPARLVGVDRSREGLQIAGACRSKFPEILLLRGNALDLPFKEKSFDFIVCSLVLHHLPPDQGVKFLQALGALSRQGVVISDLRRGRIEYAVTFLFTRLFTRERMTRSDGPLSVLRALTLDEARSLTRAAGWTDCVVRKSFPLRLVLMDREIS
jgi:SAM-dependent methyltransferase